MRWITTCPKKEWSITYKTPSKKSQILSKYDLFELDKHPKKLGIYFLLLKKKSILKSNSIMVHNLPQRKNSATFRRQPFIHVFIKPSPYYFQKDNPKCRKHIKDVCIQIVLSRVELLELDQNQFLIKVQFWSLLQVPFSQKLSINWPAH